MVQKSNLRKFFLGRSLRDYKQDQQKAQKSAEEHSVTRLAEAGGITLRETPPANHGQTPVSREQDKRLATTLSKRKKLEETPKRAALMKAMKVLHKQRQEIFSDLSSERRESLRMMAEFMLGVGSKPKSVVESTIVTTPSVPSAPSKSSQGHPKEKKPTIRYGVKSSD